MDRQQESVDLESARGGVRRPRSEAARRPRPQSRFLSALTDSKPSASHPSDGSYREVVDEETVDAEAQEKSANDRTRESDADRIHGNEKDKVGWSKERDGRVRDAGTERGDRNRNQTVQNGSREGRVGSEIKPKSAERFLPEQKQFVPTKLKLKVGGITHTLVSDSMKKKPVPSNALEIQDSDEEDEMTEPQFDYPPLKSQKKDIDIAHSPSFRPRPQMREGGVDHSSPSGRFIGQSRAKPLFEPKAISESPSLAVRKSSRIPKRRVLDGDEEESEDANLTQRPLSHGRGVRRVEEEIEQEEGQQPEEEDSEDEDLTEKASGLISDDEHLEDLEEEDDEEVAGRAKRAKVQQLHGSGSKGKPSTGTALTARQRSMQSSKEADGDAVLSLIEFPGGLASPLGRKGKGKLSEAERQVKRADAARRRKQQVEKAAIEIQATAIQKILGQDSTRKRREDRLQKRRQEIEQEKKMAELVPATNTIRWSLGPSGTVVSFAEDVGLPNLFNTGPCRYPPAREKCYAPSCPNTYKYRDSKLKVPLCSLECYKVVHAIAST
ncbi:unnamed protein product [Sphagnum jensenii]|uniref:INO80 complex subunit B-like conserved region domain-containing protein n=1 Tax=Sphagnum jensenii TaxID=128206 RepID=A0ABP0W409_9BRYO